MKVGTATVKQIEHHELEKYIQEVYGFEDPKFSIVAMEEWNNDSDHLFHMKKEPLDPYDQKGLDRWKAYPLDHHPYRLRVILQDMVNNGHLEEGNYLISVCW